MWKQFFPCFAALQHNGSNMQFFNQGTHEDPFDYK